jgi:hypothetical protein
MTDQGEWVGLIVSQFGLSFGVAQADFAGDGR